MDCQRKRPDSSQKRKKKKEVNKAFKHRQFSFSLLKKYAN